MRIDLHAGELVLAENHPLAIRRARGTVIACTRGTVWITVGGEAEDIFLEAGQSYRIAGNGLALIEAVGAGQVRVETRPDHAWHDA